MCFSATASFSAAAFLGAAGAATLAQRPRAKDRAFAAIPAIFAAHQAIEGAIWLHIDHESVIPYPLIAAYLFVAQVLWPAYIPASVILIEPGERRTPALWLLLAAGLLVSAALAYILINHRYAVTAIADGLRYATDQEFERRLLALYLLAVVAPLFLSRYRYVIAFGAVTLAGAIVTVLAFYYAAASVWCFFSALASICVFMHVRAARREGVRKTAMKFDGA